MVFFRCTVGGSGKGNTVTVTCAEEFAGLTITLSKTGKTYTKTCPSTTPYVVTFSGVENGTYTVSTTYGGQTYSETVVVQDISCVLNYGFTWRLWVDTASQLDSSDYDTLDEVLADEKAVRELFLEHACVDYMAELASSNEDLETVINNDLCAKWINLSDYALDYLHANEVIADLMDEADKYFYGEWALMPQVPTMTSNTAPYGVASASSQYSNDYAAWKAFDGNSSTRWNGSNSSNTEYLAYTFNKPTIVKMVYMLFHMSSSNAFFKHGYIQAYNGEEWISLKEVTNSDSASSMTVTIENDVAYEQYRLYCDESYVIGSSIYQYSICELQFYAWAPKGNVPKMTSATAPYGEVIASNYDGSSYPYLAFDGNEGTIWGPKAGDNTPYLGYKFTNPVCVRRVSYSIRNSNAGRPVRTIVVQGSNDNSTWEDLGSFDLPGGADLIVNTVDISNTEYYLYYRLYCSQALNVQSSWWYPFMSLQFYGRELKVSVPKMTSNTAPYGEAIYSSYRSVGLSTPMAPYMAFDKSTAAADGWQCYNVEPPQYVGYKFTNKIKVKQIRAYMYANRSFTWKFQASDNGIDWTDLTEEETLSVSNGTWFVREPSKNEGGYQYYRLYLVNFTNSDSGKKYQDVGELQFYGLDYSEKEFEVGTTKKWLYDHGVELETITEYNQSGVYTEKTEHSLVKTTGGSGNYTAGFVAASVDLTNYNLLRAKIGKDIDCSNIVYLSVRADATPAYGATSVAQYVFGNSNYVPNNVSLDISNVNQSLYASMFSKITAGIFELVELWLE